MILHLQRAYEATVSPLGEADSRHLITVVAASLPRASAALEKDFPGCTVWDIHHIGSKDILILDCAP